MLWKKAEQGKEGQDCWGQVAILQRKIKLSLTERKLEQSLKGGEVIGQDVWEMNIPGRGNIHTSRRLTGSHRINTEANVTVLSGWRGAGGREEIAEEPGSLLALWNLAVIFCEMENHWRVWAEERHELTSVINTLADVLRTDRGEKSWKLWDLLGG